METIDNTLQNDTMQNRDILKWVDRLEKAKHFEESAQTLIDNIGVVITTDALSLFKNIFTDIYEEHVTPRGATVTATIDPPYIKKILGENETFFSAIKEYPFYYILHINIGFYMNSATDTIQNNSEYFGEWYSSKMIGVLEEQIINRLKNTIDKELIGKIVFPKNKDGFTEEKINIVLSSSLSVSKDTNKFQSKSSVANFTVKNPSKKTFATTLNPNNEILINSIAMALSRSSN